jgi:hypothetical protein
MIRFRNFLPFIAVAALLCANAPARAGYVGNLTLTVSGDATGTTTTNAQSAGFTLTNGGLTVITAADVFGTSNSNAEVANSTSVIKNANSTGSATVTIYFSADYDSPLGSNSTLKSTLTINTAGGTWSMSLIGGQVDSNPNTANNNNYSQASTLPVGDVAINYVNIPTSPFTIKGHATITVAAGSNVKFQLTENVIAAPAPASAILALAGLPMIGLVFWNRRRKAPAQELAMSVA